MHMLPAPHCWFRCCGRSLQHRTKLRNNYNGRVTSVSPGSDTAVASTLEPAEFPFTPVLNDIRVVLVAPRVPANVGAVARVCANFEAPNLWVVAPRCDPHDGEVYKVACGEAVLSRMRVVDTLEEALEDTSSSIGFTRRAGATRITHSSISEMLQEYPQAIPGMVPGAAAAAADDEQQQLAAAGGLTALVFGREESGLLEVELRCCTHACALPTGRIQSSMNLSHAVAVVGAELYARRTALMGQVDLGLELAGDRPEDRPGLQPVSAAELSALLAKVAGIARAVGLSGDESLGGGNQSNHGRRRLPLGHLKAMLGRAKPTTWEVRSLHKLATAVLAAVGGTAEPQQGLPDSSNSSSGSSSGQQAVHGTDNGSSKAEDSSNAHSTCSRGPSPLQQ